MSKFAQCAVVVVLSAFVFVGCGSKGADTASIEYDGKELSLGMSESVIEGMLGSSVVEKDGLIDVLQYDAVVNVYYRDGAAVYISTPDLSARAYNGIEIGEQKSSVLKKIDWFSEVESTVIIYFANGNMVKPEEGAQWETCLELRFENDVVANIAVYDLTFAKELR